MRQLKLFGVVFAALLASTVALSASALAATPLPSVLPGIASKWTSKGVGTVLFFTASSKVPTLCGKVKGEGTLETTKRTLGEFHLTFEECNDPALKVTCTGTGDSAGVILALGTWHAVVDASSPELTAAILFLISELGLTCTGFASEAVKGSVLCLIREPLATKTSHEFHCTMETGPKGEDLGKPTETKYFNDSGELVTIEALLWSFNKGAFEESAVDLSGTMEYAESIKFDD
jgi:hypothetical protein